ncbi:cysteine proteinase [Stipitochalara longipes BDJ]|nr:cysteine proteinase [Stipitochalara longipes BDJ]
MRVKALTETKKITDTELLNRTLTDCFTSLDGFLTKINKYSKGLGLEGSGNWFKDSYRKIRWPEMKEDVASFRESITIYLSMFQVLLQGAGFDMRETDKKDLNERLDDAEVKEGSRFDSTNQKIELGFSSQRIVLDRIFDTVQGLSNAGISNKDAREVENIRALERQSTGLAFQPVISVRVLDTLEEVIAACRYKVVRVIKSQRRLNLRYTDQYFDCERDLRLGLRFCIDNLVDDGISFQPGSCLALPDIFEDPSFFVDSVAATTAYTEFPRLRQIGSALMAIGTIDGLIERICVARDEHLGIYGFIFFRDGQWISQIIDSQLYLEKTPWSPTFLDTDPFIKRMNRRGRETSLEEVYRKTYLTNSEALYFTSSLDSSETWPSLLEKAYAKAHGDYGSISVGFIGDTLEDLTGGVTFENHMSEILDKQFLWAEQLQLVGRSSVYVALIPGDSSNRDLETEESTYEIATVLRVAEVMGKRLLYLRSPTFKWNGPWSDGSKDWTPESIQALGHRFGDDESFWISYEDFLTKFPVVLEHRLFGEDWKIAQQWIAVEIPWADEFLKEHFKLKIAAQSGATEVVIVLSQLDSSYFKGLEGCYRFEIQFKLYSEKDGKVSLVARTPRRKFSQRSVAMRLDIESSQNFILRPRILATKLPNSFSISNVIDRNAISKRDKLLQAALSYDLAHASIPGWRDTCEKIQKKQEARTQKAAPVDWEAVSKSDGNGDPGPKNESDTPYAIRRQELLGKEDWDAICVLGLRVYARDADTVIEVDRGELEKQSRVRYKRGEPNSGSDFSDDPDDSN